MSLEYIGKCKLLLEDDDKAVYAYSGENWNNGGKSAVGDKDLLDGKFTYKHCLEDREKFPCTYFALNNLLRSSSALDKEHCIRLFLILFSIPCRVMIPSWQPVPVACLDKDGSRYSRLSVLSHVLTVLI